MKYFVVLLFLCNSVFSQPIILNQNSIDNSDSSLISDKYLVFNLVKIEPRYIASIDSIVGKYKLPKNNYFYLNFTSIDETGTFILADSDIEMHVDFNQLFGIKNRAILVNNKIVFIRDEQLEDKIYLESDDWILLKNPKEVDCRIIFRETSYWTFEDKNGKINLLGRVIYNR